MRKKKHITGGCILVLVLAVLLSACRGANEGDAGDFSQNDDGRIAVPVSSPPVASAEAVCPPVTQAALADHDVRDLTDFQRLLLAFLNAGGDPQQLQSLLENTGFALDPKVLSFDVNGDGVAEFAFMGRILGVSSKQPQGGIIMFYCADGLYRAQTLASGYYIFNPALTRMVDIDRDGRHEAVFQYVTGGTTCRAGVAVVSLTDLQVVDRFGEGVLTPYCEFSIDFADVNYDGDLELLVSGRTGEVYSRAVTYTYALDESGRFAIKSVQTAASSLRIHVLEDAQSALARGDYPLAVEYYELAAYSDQLQDVAPLDSSSSPIGEAAAEPYHQEYLTAFASFRLVALYLLQGSEAEASEALSRMDGDYPEGSPGAEFVPLARVLIEEFANQRSPEETCSSVTRTIMAQYPALADALGDWGLPALSFRPQTICPFYVEES